MFLPGMRGTCYGMMRHIASSAWARLRGGIWPVTQTSVAAGIAWYLTHNVLVHAQPFFAPIAAAVSLSASNVLRSQRVLQLITGVALGIGIGVGVAAVAEGPVAIGVAVLIAMCAALAVGGGFFGHGLMFVNQTAASAILIIGLHRSGSGSERLVDALIGGGVVLVISLLVFPAAPLRVISRATRNLGIALGEALGRLNEQIARRQPAEPGWVLDASRHIHGALAQLAQARSTARNIVRIAPLRWHCRASVTAATKRAAQLDLLGNSVLGLLRACQAAIMAGDDLPADLRNDVGQLRAAVSALADNGIDAGEGTATVEPVRRLAQRAPPGDGAYTPLVTSLVRACARDVLRIHGLSEGA